MARDRSESRERSRSRSKSKSRERSRTRSRSKSKDRSRSRTKSRSRSRSRSHDRRSRSRTYSPVRMDPSGRKVVNGRIHVSDFPASLSKRDLERAFDRYGKVVDLWMATYPPYYAFITYKYDDDAERAIRKMNDEYVAGHRVRVAHALPKRNSAPRQWGGGGRGYGGSGGYGGRDRGYGGGGGYRDRR